MFQEEADWIIDKLRSIDLSGVKNGLNIGAGDWWFRTKTQPEQGIIFSFLKEKGIALHHLDQKPGEGIDFVTDVRRFSPERPYHIIFLTNVLEHLRNPKEIVQRVLNFLVPGGYLVVTVPRFYRRHPDPIDTGFRPTDRELQKLFPDTQVLFSEVIRIKRPRDRLGKLLGVFGIRWQVSCLVLKKK